MGAFVRLMVEHCFPHSMHSTAFLERIGRPVPTYGAILGSDSITHLLLFYEEVFAYCMQIWGTWAEIPLASMTLVSTRY